MNCFPVGGIWGRKIKMKMKMKMGKGRKIGAVDGYPWMGIGIHQYLPMIVCSESIHTIHLHLEYPYVACSIHRLLRDSGFYTDPGGPCRSLLVPIGLYWSLLVLARTLRSTASWAFRRAGLDNFRMWDRRPNFQASRVLDLQAPADDWLGGPIGPNPCRRHVFDVVW